MLQGFIIAFSIYSKVPMPYIKQTNADRKYVTAFFPFVGLLISAFIGIWLYFAPIFHFSRLFISCIAVILPFFITGNIHFNGFLYTIDALSLKQEKVEKLKLLESHHQTISSCIHASLYILFSFCIWNELYPFFVSNTENDMIIICLLMLIYIISRCLGGLSILTFPRATETGTVAALSHHAQLKSNKIILLLILFICCLIGFFLQPMLSPFLLASGVFFFFIFRLQAIKNFGGITDEILGYFIQSCELILLTVFLLGCKYFY